MATKKETIKTTTTTKRNVKKIKKTDIQIKNPENAIRDSVEKLAYEIWEKRGCQTSDGLSEWMEAEQIIIDKISAN